MDNAESPARRAFGARDLEANGVVVIETTRRLNPIPIPQRNAGPVYTRKSYTCPAGKSLYEATGSGGYISVRASMEVMRYAIDVADPAGKTARQRAGRIYAFFANESQAELAAQKLRAEGLVANVVEARPYGGQE